MAKNRESETEPEIEESIGTEEEGEVEEEEEEEVEEEEEEEEVEEEESGSEDETPQPKIRPVNSIPNPPSENEEGSDFDSYVMVKKSAPGITSTADDDLANPRKPKSNTEISVPASPAKPGAKRPAEKEVEVKEMKKSKKNAGSTEEGEKDSGVKELSAVNDNSKKQLFQRLWSEEDEIVILKGMLDYSAKKNADPVSDFSAFLEFIRKSLHVEVTKTQLQYKVRSLKRKFANTVSKEKSGRERLSLKPHDQMAFELSKKIWGTSSISNGNVGNETVPKTRKASVSVARRRSNLEGEDHVSVEVFKNGSFTSSLSYSSVSEWIVNDGAKMIEGEKREEMEEKWKKIQKQEVEVFLKRTEFMCEQTKLVLEAMRKSDN